jgi:hypothetical protein
VLTGLLSWLTWSINDRNESRLLRLQVQEGVTALGSVVPTVQTPLASAVELAQATGDPARFAEYMSTYVGSKGLFVYASLWRVTDGVSRRVGTVGRLPGTAGGKPSTPQGRSFVAGAASRTELSVIGHLGGRYPRIGFAYSSSGGTPKYVAFAETLMSPRRQIGLSDQSGFADLDFALYLGRTEDRRDLMASTIGRRAISGRMATATVPFGDTVLTVVATPKGQLGGTLLGALPWIVGIVGVVLSAGAGLMAGWLAARRKVAEELADENRRLYGEQHSIAEALQRALLPEEMPAIPGFEIEARYLAGVKAMDIGGDWYDVIPTTDGGLFFVVGDVSGRGLRAATVMASLRYAIRAYVALDDQPESVLRKLCSLLDVTADDHFATVLCGRVTGDRQLLLANAGHFPPVLVTGGGAAFVPVEPGLPVGVAPGATYRLSRSALPAAGTLLAFTDGLVERRGEHLGTGLERLRRAAGRDAGPLGSVLDGILADLASGDHDDDTAILGLRWPA